MMESQCQHSGRDSRMRARLLWATLALRLRNRKCIMTAIFILGFDCCERFRARVYNLG